MPLDATRDAGAIASRYAHRDTTARLRARWQLADRVSLHAGGSRRRVELANGTADDYPAIADAYAIGSVPGFATGVDAVRGELALHIDRRATRHRFQSAAVPSTGVAAHAYGGWQQSVGADPARFAYGGVDVIHHVAARPDFGELRAFDVAITNRIGRALSSTPAQRALGTNSLDEAPSSTWFVNRIGVRDVGVDAIRRSPGAGRGPDRSAPLRVTRAKHVGQIPGFIAEDAAGVRWLSDVVVGETATFSDARGRKRPMTTGDLDATFARAVRGPRGYRILASKLLPGTPIGAAPLEGVRADDPNDTIPHALRREWRGLYVFAAWLQHTDFKEMGTLDVWDTDPVDPSRKVVFHYLVDFGNTLGLYARHRPDEGHTEKRLDLDHLKSLASFGLWKRPWEGVRSPGIAGVGAFDVEHFDPGGFTPYAPFSAFLAADASDALWATKILLRLTPEHIRAALEAGQFEDPRAIDYLVGVLVGRQRKTARYWFDRIAPIDAPRFEHGRLCVRDLAVAHDLATAPRS